ncbi:MAG: molybdenum cofactor biosynthesis protein MoaE, partial [Cytophagaceae bacterium]
MQIDLTDQPIDVAAVIAAAESEEAGAVNAFIGTVRNRSEGRRVVRLHYEAYPPMA